MEKSKFQTVVQGEASESDDDEVHVSSVNIKPFPSRVLQTSLESKKTAGGQAVVVEGEASESEEEEEVEVDTSLNSTKLPPLKVEPQKKVQYGSSGDLSDVPTLMSPRMADLRFNKPKYDTLLHRKLRENNWHLHDNMLEVAGQMYLGASRSLGSTTAHLLKSHSTLQDISHAVRLLTNDLFHLDDRISIILSCKLLPDINLTTDAQGGATSIVSTP
ncbi:biogenesis of lysosome-related organelles complex 1 subunit 3-like isoform X1 [Pomacea canaliculata]|uniref:biogenesis of lysosome-related organelles complex 1 subunit 3-like isoform X1 n=1 Tax=Pomacea canaliculata TaxID=400727 RepID=UPI000D727CAC|nr:biogenesis of lysosome-related organelles complex 1 subunit 3-like isoform X1 [Pomacea canaliculata]